MSDPRRKKVIHTCYKCQKTQVCRGTCQPANGQKICAVCAAQNVDARGQ